MRPTSFFWLFSSVLLLANAVPVPLDSSGLANAGESDSFEVDPANVDRRRRELDETIDLEKRQKKTKASAAPKPVKPKPTKAIVKPAKAKPVKATVKPTKATVKPVKAKPTVKPTKATVRPAKATVKPVKAKPTKATVKPTKPTVKPTKATVKPVKAKPTRATVKPTKPTVKPTKATVKPTKATAKPTTKPTTNPTKTSSKPAATGTGKSCPIRKGPRGLSLEKRAVFDKNSAPKTITITVEDKDFALTKLGALTQGICGITYQVDATGDFAKTNTEVGGCLADEIKVTKLVGQLVASGTDTNCKNKIQAEWIVTKKSPGKKIRSTTAFETAVAAGKEKCEAALVKAREAVKVAHAEFFKKTGGFNHNDLNADNVFFTDDLATAFLIDFGLASAGAEIKGAKLQKDLEELFFPNFAFCP